jgi:nicotinate-nucleotide--dimethylbenzimidazole phosphoribosyltransferase
VAALVARALDATVVPHLLASHLSSERGAGEVLRELGLKPILDLGLRLGEGTGAILVADLVRTAVDTQRSMATFATAGIVGRPGADFPPDPSGTSRG